MAKKSSLYDETPTGKPLPRGRSERRAELLREFKEMGPTALSHGLPEKPGDFYSKRSKSTGLYGARDDE